ncbi:hypothetical protein EV426DRAFT_153491 [Tirmania nivea]|nr:hypothetical protein EV426DRAFT_153491 [Tirmania nivea]
MQPRRFFCSFASLELHTLAWYFVPAFPLLPFVPSTRYLRCSRRGFSSPSFLSTFILKPFPCSGAFIPFIWLSIWFGLLRTSRYRNERRYLRPSSYTFTAIPTGLISSALEFLHLSTPNILDRQQVLSSHDTVHPSSNDTKYTLFYKKPHSFSTKQPHTPRNRHSNIYERIGIIGKEESRSLIHRTKNITTYTSHEAPSLLIHIIICDLARSRRLPSLEPTLERLVEGTI